MREFGDVRDCRLYFGVNKEEELFALDALEELRATLTRLNATICVWKPETNWSGFVGTPAEALAVALADGATRPDIYVCGPPALIEATEATALAGGVSHSRIFSEQFSPA
jgi:NAD(P)H-flavin reductase